MENRAIKKTSLRFYRFIDKNVLWLFAAVVTIIAFVLRYFSAMHPTNDIVGYVLNGWMKDIEAQGFQNFYKVNADYSTFFLFIVGLFTFLPKGPQVNINGYVFYQNLMYYVKSVYFLMDLLSAIGIFLIIYHLTKNKVYALIGYMVFLVLPVQFANSALWGNADSMYFCCFIYCLLFVLKRKDFWVFFFAGLAISLKLQAVFILPFLVYLIFSRRLKISRFYGYPLAILLSFIPSYCCGASFTEPMQYFVSQVNGYSKLTLGCANIWYLFELPNMNNPDSPLNQASIYIALALIFVLTAIIYLRKIKLTDENIIYVATFLISIVPFFLPHMHERYFYALDGLVLVYALTKRKRYYLIPLMQVSSGIAYYHYLSGFKKYFIDILGEDSVYIAVFINIAVLTIIFYDLMHLEHRTLKEDIAKMDQEINKIELTEKCDK